MLTINGLSLKLILLICIFAAGSWVEINGIWVELPILVSKSPQQWTLPSYLTVVIQLANIGPIIYLLFKKYGNCCTNIRPDVLAIYIILTVGVMASLLLAFTWKETTNISGKPYSSALIILSFFLATVDCTSSVTFLPFMANFPKTYMTVYYIGEGMSGFLPSILALIQGVGKQTYTCDKQVILKNISSSFDPKKNTSLFVNTSSMGQDPDQDPDPLRMYKQKNVTEIIPSYFESEPRFSAQTFFLCICAMMVCSLTAYLLLVRLTKRQQQCNIEVDMNFTANHNKDDTVKLARNLSSSSPAKNQVSNDTTTISKSGEPLLVDHTKILSTKTFVFLLTVNSIINGLSNGILPALQSYACLPYGNNIYHLTLTLSALANPLCCFLYFYWKMESTRAIVIGACVYVTSAGYTIGIAATSPCPIWNETNVGGVVVLLVTVLGVGMVNYLKTAISTVLHSCHRENALLWNGISVQVGSLVGALLIFPMVNVYEMFKMAAPCQTC